MSKQTAAGLVSAGIFATIALLFALGWNTAGLWFSLACTAILLLTLIPKR